MKDYELIDNKERKRYEFHVEGDYVAIIEYMKTPDSIYITHTEVPRAVQGQGVANRLTQKVLEDIDRQGMKVVPLCGFAAAYISRHPEWKSMLKEGVNVG